MFKVTLEHLVENKWACSEKSTDKIEVKNFVIEHESMLPSEYALNNSQINNLFKGTDYFIIKSVLDFKSSSSNIDEEDRHYGMIGRGVYFESISVEFVYRNNFKENFKRNYKVSNVSWNLSNDGELIAIVGKSTDNNIQNNLVNLQMEENALVNGGEIMYERVKSF